MFVTEVGAVITTVLLATGHGAQFGFQFQITLWLWFTVLFANFAEAMAEGPRKGPGRYPPRPPDRNVCQSSASRNESVRKRSRGPQLRKDEWWWSRRVELIPGDGEVIDGAATVDESAITGESAPVIRESGGDRSAVTGGTRVLSDRHQDQDYFQPRRDLSGSDDWSGRRRGPAENA